MTHSASSQSMYSTRKSTFSCGFGSWSLAHSQLSSSSTVCSSSLCPCWGRNSSNHAVACQILPIWNKFVAMGTLVISFCSIWWERILTPSSWEVRATLCKCFIIMRGWGSKLSRTRDDVRVQLRWGGEGWIVIIRQTKGNRRRLFTLWWDPRSNPDHHDDDIALIASHVQFFLIPNPPLHLLIMQSEITEKLARKLEAKQASAQMMNLSERINMLWARVEGWWGRMKKRIEGVDCLDPRRPQGSHKVVSGQISWWRRWKPCDRPNTKVEVSHHSSLMNTITGSILDRLQFKRRSSTHATQTWSWWWWKPPSSSNI